MQDIYFMKQKYYNLILSYPKSTLAFILVTSFFVMAGMLFIKVDNNLMNQLPENIESRTIYESIKEEFGATDFIFIAMGTPGDTIINLDSIKDLWSLTNDLSTNLDGVEEVISLTEIQDIVDVYIVFAYEYIESIKKKLQSPNVKFFRPIPFQEI